MFQRLQTLCHTARRQAIIRRDEMPMVREGVQGKRGCRQALVTVDVLKLDSVDGALYALPAASDDLSFGDDTIS